MKENAPHDRAPLCAGPQRQTGRPALKAPGFACDTHAHILGPASEYPYLAQRVYTPPDCLLPDYRAMLAALGMTRCVLVQPSVYGTDNRVLVQALCALGESSRGVAVIGEDASDSELQALHDAGVRGVRVNIVDLQDKSGGLPLAMLQALAEKIAGRGWHLELLAHVNDYPQLDTMLARLPVPVVFGHFGYAPAQRGTDDAGVQALIRMAERGQAWIKMTGPYRLTPAPLPYEAVTPLAHEMLARCPDQLLWGSDWPHVMLKGEMPDDARLLDLLLGWVPDASLRQRILCDNPARLYGW